MTRLRLPFRQEDFVVSGVVALLSAEAVVFGVAAVLFLIDELPDCSGVFVLLLMPLLLLLAIRIVHYCTYHWR